MTRCAWLLVLLGCPDPVPPTGLPSPAPVQATPPEPTPGPTMDLRVVAYNVESGDAEPVTISGHVGRVEGEHIWGFSEVLNQSWLDAFTTAANDVEGDEDFSSLLGTTGGADRLAVAWDTTVVTYQSHEELVSMQFGNYRAPLAVTFLLNGTDIRFVFVVNHLARGDASVRHQQAERLNTWATQQTLPLITAGDFNFDWDVETGDTDRDAGYDNLVEDGHWSWVRPDDLIKTQCWWEEDSVLDFVFAGGPARDWEAEGDILLRQAIFCNDNPQTPDHRPVDAVFSIPLPVE